MLLVAGQYRCSPVHTSDTTLSQPEPRSIETAPKASEPVSPERCHVGELSESVPHVTIGSVLDDRESHEGQVVRARGYLIFGEREVTGLMDANDRKRAIHVQLLGLPVASVEEILPCRSRLVDFQGRVGHFRKGEREVPILFAEALRGISE